MLADRHVVAWQKAMFAKAIAAFIIVGVAVDIVVKRPMAAWLSDEMPKFAFLQRANGRSSRFLGWMPTFNLIGHYKLDMTDAEHRCDLINCDNRWVATAPARDH